jgi:hypothetical protein
MVIQASRRSQNIDEGRLRLAEVADVHLNPTYD